MKSNKHLKLTKHQIGDIVSESPDGNEKYLILELDSGNKVVTYFDLQSKKLVTNFPNFRSYKTFVLDIHNYHLSIVEEAEKCIQELLNNPVKGSSVSSLTLQWILNLLLEKKRKVVENQLCETNLLTAKSQNDLN